VNDVPTVLQVLDAIRPDFEIGGYSWPRNSWMKTRQRYANNSLKRWPAYRFPTRRTTSLKKRVPYTVGLIRTADTIQYANIILVSA